MIVQKSPKANLQYEKVVGKQILSQGQDSSSNIFSPLVQGAVDCPQSQPEENLKRTRKLTNKVIESKQQSRRNKKTQGGS